MSSSQNTCDNKSAKQFINRVILSTPSIFSVTFTFIIIFMVLLAWMLYRLTRAKQNKTINCNYGTIQILHTENQWMKLSKPPFHYAFISHILTLNEIELLIICKIDHKLKEIWIYNICNDNYTKLIHEKSVNECIRCYTASLNDNTSFLYL
eukprot:121221_1